MTPIGVEEQRRLPVSTRTLQGAMPIVRRAGDQVRPSRSVIRRSARPSIVGATAGSIVAGTGCGMADPGEL